MDDALREAYRRSEYRVDDAGYVLVLRVEVPSAELRACHEAFGVTCSTFITAWNPHSVPSPLHDNEAALARLQSELASRRLRWLRGAGVDPAGEWPAEPSFLVFGLEEASARECAARFGQNAVVCASRDAVPRLVICT